jgi:transaldolase
MFADGADEKNMFEMYQKSSIKGLTTNPTLMRQAGVANYSKFCKDILSKIVGKPISFEVFADEFVEMERQAEIISSWGENVYVKIPIMNTRGESSAQLIKSLVNKGIKVNVTAIMTMEQVQTVIDSLSINTESYISIFAGRIADTGIDPLPFMIQALELMKKLPKAELIWASPREILNLYQAEKIGCHIITVTKDILSKLNLNGYDLHEYSLDTVKMFYKDAESAGYTI